MRVVYSPAHLGHDVTTQTVIGVQIPANEVADRAERIRRTLAAEGGYYIPALGENARTWLRGAEGRAYEPQPALGFSTAGSRA